MFRFVKNLVTQLTSSGVFNKNNQDSNPPISWLQQLFKKTIMFTFKYKFMFRKQKGWAM